MANWLCVMFFFSQLDYKFCPFNAQRNSAVLSGTTTTKIYWETQWSG